MNQLDQLNLIDILEQGIAGDPPVTLNKERVELFLAALENGKYLQCRGALRDGLMYRCALGVAVEVALDNGLREELGPQRSEWLFEDVQLDPLVVDWYGFGSIDPSIEIDDYVPVSTANDAGYSFWDIAQAGRATWLKDQE
jgi:hypothetical protein